MTARSLPPRRGPRRAGFTLIEIMVVIVIIAILMALLVPAVTGAIQTAREGQVKAEIQGLSYGIADFKAHFGTDPPGYLDLRLYSSSGALDPATGVLLPRTQSILRRLWPNMDIDLFTTELRGNAAKQRELDGSACLVFFLGGITPAAGELPVGFSSNPRAPLTTGGKRVGPFFEFKLSRLHDANPTAFDGYEGYLDPLPGQQVPYWYITNDRYTAQETLNGATATTASAVRPVYRQSASSFFNAQSFQIVSPGRDGVTGEHSSLPGGVYGAGGVFDPKAGTVTDNLPAGHALKGLAEGDGDNITNFHEGKLVP